MTSIILNALRELLTVFLFIRDFRKKFASLPDRHRNAQSRLSYGGLVCKLAVIMVQCLLQMLRYR
jgi:hypothetical protein